MRIELRDPLTLPCGATLPNRLVKAAMSEALGTRERRVTTDVARDRLLHVAVAVHEVRVRGLARRRERSETVDRPVQHLADEAAGDLGSDLVGGGHSRLAT